MMEALTAFDAVAIVIVIVSTLMALARGFMRELATLGAFIAAIAAAMLADRPLVDMLQPILPDSAPEATARIIVFVGIFLTSLYVPF